MVRIHHIVICQDAAMCIYIGQPPDVNSCKLIVQPSEGGGGGLVQPLHGLLPLLPAPAPAHSLGWY